MSSGSGTMIGWDEGICSGSGLPAAGKGEI